MVISGAVTAFDDIATLIVCPVYGQQPGLDPRDAGPARFG